MRGGACLLFTLTGARAPATPPSPATGSTRLLFYYPKSTIQVAVFDPNIKPGE